MKFLRCDKFSVFSYLFLLTFINHLEVLNLERLPQSVEENAANKNKMTSHEWNSKILRASESEKERCNAVF
jgi:hypothetical protein